jgi:hypothetical protein
MENKTEQAVVELTSLQMRVGEVDVRKLNKANQFQIMYRFMNDTLTLLNNLMTSVIDIEIAVKVGLTEEQQKKIGALIEQAKILKKEDKQEEKK